MTIKTDVKAGSGWGGTNHNETLTVRTDVKAGTGWGGSNHNEELTVRSDVRGGGIVANHNETLNA